MQGNTTIVTIAAAFVFAGGLALPATARAEPGSTVASAGNSIGFRVGGYGYRNTNDSERGAWDDCKMNGVGVFGQRELGEHWFAEAGLDIYSTPGAQTTAGEEGAMDRVSGVATIAGGGRIELGRFTPYVQAGLGAEVTRIRLAGAEDRAVHPMGFVGLGVDLRVTRGLHIGMNVRTNVMQHYLHGDQLHSGAGELTGPADEHAPLASELDLAAQGQFFLRYRL